MRVLLLGGTGAMGIYVKEFLINQGGCDVFITSRRPPKNKKGINYIQGNAKNLEFLRELCVQHWDVIVDFMVYSTNELQDRVDLLLGATDQYVFISSARVYADYAGKITEQSPRLLDVCTDSEYLSTDEYALAKAREENILFSNNKKNWTIVRPSLTYGEDRLQLGVYEKENWLYRALRGRSIVFSKDLMDNYYTLSYGRDVAEGIAAIVGKQNAIGEVFHIVQDKSFQWKDILSLYLYEIEKITGKRPHVILTDQCTNLKLDYAKYQVLYGRYFNRFFDNTKISEHVNTTNWLSPDIGLAKCIEAFLQNPKFLSIDWRKEALIDKAAHEWTPIWEIPGKRDKLQYLKHRIF